MYKILISIIVSICPQVFSTEDPPRLNCPLSLVSSSNKTLSRNQRKREEASYISNIKNKANHFLTTVEVLNLDTDILITLWEGRIYYILDLVRQTPGQLSFMGIDQKSITKIKAELFKRGLTLEMRFDNRIIQEDIDSFNKRQKFLYQIFRRNIHSISLHLDRGEYKKRLEEEIEKLRQNYLYRPLITEFTHEYHRDGVFGDIKSQLQGDHRLPHYNEGLQDWILSEVEIIMDMQGITNQHEI